MQQSASLLYAIHLSDGRDTLDPRGRHRIDYLSAMLFMIYHTIPCISYHPQPFKPARVIISTIISINKLAQGIVLTLRS